MLDKWTLSEFNNINIGDKRLNRRIYSLSASLSGQPLAPINKATDDWAATKAAYNFFNNKKVTPEKILSPHIQNTIDRCEKYPFVLALQDSSSFNYTAHESKKDFGTIGNGSKSEEAQKSKGLYIHPTLAVSPEGLPLGLLSNYFWKRTCKEEEFESDEKESARWVNSVEELREQCHDRINFISVGDRESDFNEYLLSFIGDKNHFLIRSKANRKIKESCDKLHLFMKKSLVRDEFKIEVVNKKGKGNRQVKKKLKGRFKGEDGSFKRIANLKLQYEKVHLYLHSGHRNREDIELPISVVRVFEERENMETGEYPIEWILITSIEVENSDIAKLMVDFYNKRWTIETYFKTLKSGCNVEDCRLETYKGITAYIALFTVIAWRIAWMAFVKRTDPDEPCTTVLSDIEWKALYATIHKTKKIPKAIPKVDEVVIWIARLGGYLNRKSDPPPGNTVIWRGWERLSDLALMKEILQ